MNRRVEANGDRKQTGPQEYLSISCGYYRCHWLSAIKKSSNQSFIVVQDLSALFKIPKAENHPLSTVLCVGAGLLASLEAAISLDTEPDCCGVCRRML